MAPTDVQKDLTRLEGELKRLEAEYNMFFAGRLPRPPVETRGRVAALVKQYDRMHIANTGDRFRFTTLQSRYASLVELWDRGLRSREEGRPGPFGQKAPSADAPQGDSSRIRHVAAFHNPLKEMDKLKELYESLSEARRETGSEPVPFSKFTELVKTQVNKFKEAGGSEVAFRVAIKDGKVNFTAKAVKVGGGDA